MEKKFFEKPTIYVGEVNIKVTNMEKSLTFYKEIMGFDVLGQSERKAALTADGKTPLLVLEQPSGIMPKEERTTGLYHFAILLPSRADLSSFLKHMIQTRTRIGASDHYVSEALYLSDPDGNGIEVYHDRLASEWSWADGQVAMATEPLDGDGLLAESEKEWVSLPNDTVMGHIHLHVADLEKTREFYITGLGFKVVTNYPGALFTSTGDYHHHIGLNVWNGAGAKSPSKNSVGLNWFTLIFPDENTRDEAVNRLQKIGAEVKREADYVMTEDPSGNVIQLRIN
ncbi:glyoxalase [Virgibacillus profundi]|uniref:Glyoxalase n=1 Tax=Virgibacillus profundi TaxID=2024555 RepID=A0A2A2IAG3_9BACI|nr:VOC family protein [Virgibacillus profundi]PAV28274.1 glyoxalase [Virgibacillus profundi]PXY52578.1 glyoxalase [Virgibacillus profundi]